MPRPGIGIGKLATASSPPIPRRAADVSTAAKARKISAKICCFSTALTPNPSSFPRGLSQKNLLRLKPETDFRDAALVEPLACVVQGVEDTKLDAGQNVLVIGAGPIGLMFVALAKNLGCHVTVAGRRAARLEAAQRLGAEQVIDIGDGRELAAQNPCGDPDAY